jgi:invasion protein IalB
MSYVKRGWGLLIMLLITGPMNAQEPREYQDWALRCPEGAPCVLEQRVFVEGAEQAPLLYISFQALERSSPLLVLVRMPLNVLLTPGLQLKVEDQTPSTVPIHHCRAQGCMALFPLTPPLRQALENGRQAQVSFHMLDGSRIGVPVSLLGITAGLSALEAAAKRNEKSKNRTK